MLGEQINERCQHIIAFGPSLDMDRWARPAKFVDHRQHPERLAIMDAVGNEVVTPQPDAVDSAKLQSRCWRTPKSPFIN